MGIRMFSNKGGDKPTKPVIRAGVKGKAGEPGPTTVGAARKRRRQHKQPVGKRKKDSPDQLSQRRTNGGEVGQLGTRPAVSPGPEAAIDENTVPRSPHEAIRAAVDTMAQVSVPARNERGQLLPGETANGKSLARSKKVWAELVGAKKWIIDQLTVDLDLDHASFTLKSLADAFAEITLLRQSLFIHMMEGGGPLTGGASRDAKKIKSSLHVYVAMVDREDKLARSLGLTRRELPINPMDAVQKAVEAARANPATTRDAMSGANGAINADPFLRDVIEAEGGVVSDSPSYARVDVAAPVSTTGAPDPFGRTDHRGKPGWPKGKPRGPRVKKTTTVTEKGK